MKLFAAVQVFLDECCDLSSAHQPRRRERIAGVKSIDENGGGPGVKLRKGPRETLKLKCSNGVLYIEANEVPFKGTLAVAGMRLSLHRGGAMHMPPARSFPVIQILAMVHANFRSSAWEILRARGAFVAAVRKSQ
jgi:hypothetical protein